MSESRSTVDRVERLTNLLALLLETPRPLTLVEIESELRGQYVGKDATRRAGFERDKAALRAIGVPIETTVLSGAQAGVSAYRIDRARYELADLDLEPDERQALQVAVAAIRPAAGEPALWKLGVDLSADAAVGAVTATVPDLPQLPALREAAARRAVVQFEYREKGRQLDPYGLLLRAGFWYVVGRDHEHDEVRTYRVDRITGAVDVGPAGAFERPADFDARQAFPVDPKLLGTTGEVTALVRVDADRAPAIERELGAGRVVERHDDGSIDVEVPSANHAAFRSWVLGLSEHAVVLSPADVRAEVVDWLRAMTTSRRGGGRSLGGGGR
jgi:predicted DNA-binding transcriptional regulator YafY